MISVYIVCFIILILQLSSFANPFDMSVFNYNTSNNNPSVRRLVETTPEKSTCLIVLHDRTKGYVNWMQDWFQKAVKNYCKHSVAITENKLQMRNADVVVFHAPTHIVSGSLRKHAPKAMFTMVSMEQPKYASVLANLKYLESNMDLMVTYSLATQYPGTSLPNLPISYWPLNIVLPHAVMQPARPFKEKTGYDTGVTVAVFASNCKKAGASERYKYLEELMRYIPVHSYGSCLNNRQEPTIPEDPRWPAVAQRRARKIQVLSRYKFYLAFENAPIRDYVSEKVYEGLIAGTLPVYQGTDTIHRFMPHNHSFINANSMNPRQLADHLLALSTDEAAYEAHFAFKSRTLSGDFERMALNSYVHPNVLCRICERALDV